MFEILEHLPYLFKYQQQLLTPINEICFTAVSHLILTYGKCSKISTTFHFPSQRKFGLQGLEFTK